MRYCVCLVQILLHRIGNLLANAAALICDLCLPIVKRPWPTRQGCETLNPEVVGLNKIRDKFLSSSRLISFFILSVKLCLSCSR